MNIKTLLLGTAAAFSVVGGAQAADLAVAEPVDYVKVCDVYGAGYWYIPGTDTCIRVGGYVKFFANFAPEGVVFDPTPAVAGTDAVSSSWKFSHETSINVTAQTMTDWGKATAFIDYRALSADKYADDGNGGGVSLSRLAYLDSAWFAIGGFGAGYRTSNYDAGGGYTDASPFRSDKSTDQVWWATALGAWGVALAIESPYTNRWGSSASGDFPDLVLAISGASGAWAWKVAGAVTDREFGTGWGVNGTIAADLGGGMKVKVGAAWSQDAPSFAGGTTDVSGTAVAEGTVWSAFVSGVIALSSTVGLAATYSYLDEAAAGGNKQRVSVDLTFALSKTTSAFIEGNWNDNGTAADVFSGVVAVTQKFGS